MFWPFILCCSQQCFYPDKFAGGNALAGVDVLTAAIFLLRISGFAGRNARQL
jgi:hypothetical protein